LVEEKLPSVLDDGWRASGVYESANLLHDVAQALSYLHEELRLVHGDVKPDNIGRRDGLFILLDFGVCRPECKFTTEVKATGSLRTRAPELFLTGKYEQGQANKADVWAIGATVFKAITGRFPFLTTDEEKELPRKSSPKERAEFETLIANRVR